MVDAQTSTVIATASFGAVIFGVIFVAFEFFRRKFLDIYIPNVRKGVIKSNKVQPPSSFVGSWILQIWKVSDDEIITIAGMDAYVYLRFLKMCFKITFLCSICASALLATYATSTNDDDDVVGISSFSLANISLGSIRLWAPFTGAYIFTFIFLYYIYHEYENFMVKRANYLRHGDAFIPKQTAYTVLIENIPEKYRTSDGLYSFFDSLFPGEVLHAYVAISLGPLDSAVSYREQLTSELEKYIASFEASGRKKRPMINIASIDHIQQHIWCCSCCCRNPDVDEEEETMKKNIKKNHLSSSDLIVDAIDYLNDQIALLSEEISIMQMEAIKAEDDMNIEYHKKMSNSFNKNMASSVDDLVELANKHMDDEEVAQQDNPMHLRKSIKEASLSLRESLKDMKNIDKKLLSTINDYKEKITKKMLSATGFVTFKSRRIQAIASQLPFLSEDHPGVQVVAAPPPSDIIWENMDASTTHTQSVAFLTSLMYYTGLVFWGVILTFIAAISNLSSLETYLPFLKSLDTTSYAFLQGILPVVVMIIFLSLIPVFMSTISTYIERRKTYSDVQQEVFRWFFMYQIANVYLTLLAGSTFTSISDVIDDPSSVLNYISAALPTTSVFFMNYCITQLLISMPLVSLQLNQLIYYLIIRIFYQEKQLTRTMIVKNILSNVTIEYGTALPDSLYILAIALLYWVIAPFVLIICTFVFGGTYVLMKYQYLYIFTRKYESGGKYWYGLYYYSMLALLASTFTIIAYMSIKEAITQAPLMIPLPLIIYFTWRYTEDKFKALSENIPYSAATKVDLQQGSHGVKDWESFTRDYLKQPSLTAPKFIQPYPYRINQTQLINADGLVNPIYFDDIVPQKDGDQENGTHHLNTNTNRLSRENSNSNTYNTFNNPVATQPSTPAAPPKNNNENGVNNPLRSNNKNNANNANNSANKDNNQNNRSFYTPPAFFPTPNNKK